MLVPGGGAGQLRFVKRQFFGRGAGFRVASFDFVWWWFGCEQVFGEWHFEDPKIWRTAK